MISISLGNEADASSPFLSYTDTFSVTPTPSKAYMSTSLLHTTVMFSFSFNITSLNASMISPLCASTQPADEETTKWLSFPYLSIIIPESRSPSLFTNLYAFVFPFLRSKTLSLNIFASSILFFTTRLIKIGDSVSFANSIIRTRNMLLELNVPHPIGR